MTEREDEDGRERKQLCVGLDMVTVVRPPLVERGIKPSQEAHLNQISGDHVGR